MHCTSIHDFPRVARGSLTDVFFKIRHEGYGGGGDSHRITRIRNRWLGESATIDEHRRWRGPANGITAALESKCLGDPQCAFCGDAGIRHMLARPGAYRGPSHCRFHPDCGFAGHHCLVFPDRHNPLDIDEPLVQEMFTSAGEWAAEIAFRARRSSDDDPPLFYFIAWNILSGSAIHSHLHATLNAGFAEGGAQNLADASRRYRNQFGSNFFDDFARVHSDLGLTFEAGTATAFASLVPTKEREVWIQCAQQGPAGMPPDALAAVVNVLRTFIQTADKPCPAFNIAAMFPPLEYAEDWSDFPVIVRIVDRGWPLLGVTDWATMEMFGTRVVAADPFVVASVLRAAVGAPAEICV